MMMKELKMTPLEFDDVYDFAAVLKNIKFDISKEDQKRLENQGMAAGILILKDLISNLKLAKNEINTFLAGKFGITPEEWGHLSMGETAQVIREISKIKKSGELLDFFGAVGQLMS